MTEEHDRRVRARRPWVYAAAAVVGGILALGVVTALVASPLAAIKTQDDFRVYRQAQDRRSEKAAKDRAELATQVGDLTRQNVDLQHELASLGRLLRKVGIDPSDPPIVIPPRSMDLNDSGTTSTRKPAPSTPKPRATSPKPAPSPPPRPTPRPSPAPTPEPACLVNLLGICL